MAFHYIWTLLSRPTAQPDAYPTRRSEVTATEPDLSVEHILNAQRQKEIDDLELMWMLSPPHDAPSAPRVIAAAKQRRILRVVSISAITALMIVLYGSGTLAA